MNSVNSKSVTYLISHLDTRSLTLAESIRKNDAIQKKISDFVYEHFFGQVPVQRP